jgi:membrane protease YdiL (CAAX protease family)
MMGPSQDTVGRTSSDRATARVDLVAWAAVLFGLTGVAVVSVTIPGVNPEEEFSPGILFAAYAPALAAIAVAAVRSRVGGVRALLLPVLRWRVGVGWYLLAIVVPVVIVAVTSSIYAAVDGSGNTGRWEGGLSAVAIGPLIAGPLGEEIGWRGFAQPRLQVAHRALPACVVVGLLWGTWHHWPVAAPGGAIEVLDDAAGYLRLVATAILYGWLYNSTRSLLLVMVAHAAHNLAIDLIPTPDDATGLYHLWLAVGYAAAAVVVILRTGMDLAERASVDPHTARRGRRR